MLRSHTPDSADNHNPPNGAVAGILERGGTKGGREMQANTVAGIAASLITLVLNLVALPARAGTGPDGPFLCIVEQATGFSFDKQSKSWKQTNFAPVEKFVLKRVKNNTLEGVNKQIASSPRAAWGVWEFGFDAFGSAFCAADVDDHGFLWCRGVQSIFNVNLLSGRFLRTYTGFYASDPSRFPDDRADTPVIEIGKCTAL
jgi:hypothetical protein